jgi:hypothetical protein
MDNTFYISDEDDSRIEGIMNFGKIKTHNMTDKIKKTRTPKNAESITKGALSLNLKERVELLELLKESIQAEVDGLKAMAKQAEEIANGN